MNTLIEDFEDYHELSPRAREMALEHGQPVRFVELGCFGRVAGCYRYYGLFHAGSKPRLRDVAALVHDRLQQFGNEAVREALQHFPED